MIVRDARPGEGRRFEEIRIAGWRAAYSEILHPDVLAGLALDDARVARRERWLADPPPDEVTLVAEVDGRLVGGAFLLPGRDAVDASGAELATLYVEPATWGCGVGDALLEEGFRRMPQAEQVLWTFEDNPRARRFYERHGFVHDGGRKPLPLLGEPIEVRYRRTRTPDPRP